VTALPCTKLQPRDICPALDTLTPVDSSYSNTINYILVFIIHQNKASNAIDFVANTSYIFLRNKQKKSIYAVKKHATTLTVSVIWVSWWLLKGLQQTSGKSRESIYRPYALLTLNKHNKSKYKNKT